MRDEIFYTSFTKFKDRGKKQCNSCGLKNSSKKQKTKYDEVVSFINGLNGNQCLLVSDSSDFKDINSNLKIKCKCGDIFITTFRMFKNHNKRRCDKCGYGNIGKKLSYSYSEIKDFIEGIEGYNCKLLTTKEDYKNNVKTNIQILCGKCNVEVFETNFDKFKNRNKRQCNNCGYENGGEKQSKSLDKFINEVKELTENEYLVLGEYKTTHIPILMKHNIENCHYEYEVAPSAFLSGSRCPKCMRPNFDRDTEKFKQEVFELVGDEYTVLGEYKDVDTGIEMKHNYEPCNNYQWKTHPYSFLKGTRCPKCSGTLKRTHDEFIKEVFDLVGEEYLVLGEYKNNKTKIEFKHNICGSEYEVRPYAFTSQGARCPVCNESKGEQKTRYWLQENNIYFETQYLFIDCKDKEPLPFDFAIFEDKDKTILDYLIEYDGEFHYKPINGEKQLKYQQYHDKIKDNYCINNNIKLIRIPYWEFDNIEQILKKN